MNNFQSFNILSLESRREDIMIDMIKKFGGIPFSAPSLKEIPLSEVGAQHAVPLQECADKLLNDQIDAFIFMTGVGTQYLFDVWKTKYPLDDLLAKISNTFVIARGPKPIKVLNEHNVSIDIKVPEPNTWVEVLSELENSTFNCSGKRIAIQEYGISNDRLVKGLKGKGAEVVTVPVYRWTLPDDTSQLEEAVDAVIQGEIDILLITSGIQIHHFLEVAKRLKKSEELKQELERVVISSIGPVADEAIKSVGLTPDFNPSHPKLGTLVAETAQNAHQLVAKKK